MAQDLIDFLEILEEVDFHNDRHSRTRLIRSRPNWFQNFDEMDFFKRYRMFKNTALWILDQIAEDLEYTSDSMAVNRQLMNARGWLDTRDRIQQGLQADQFLTSLFTRNADLGPLRTEPTGVISAATQVLCYARYPMHKFPVKPMEYVRALTIGELMSHMLPTENCLNAQDATQEFNALLEYVMNNEIMLTRGKGVAVWIAEIVAANEQLPAAERTRTPNVTSLSREQKIEYLVWLSYKMPVSQYLDTIPLIVISYVGVAKRGVVSKRFVEKISTGLKDDLGVDVTLESEVIKNMYTCFGRYVTADNAKAVFDAWISDLPEHARLRLTLEQTLGSGLTAFTIVGRAMRKYKNFSWSKTDKLTEGEVYNFRRAVVTVNGNLYYGFNRDLGVAKSTMFSSVAYVAKELLIALAGEMKLKNYQGWIKKPKNAAVLVKMIEEYKVKYVEDVESQEIDNQAEAEMKDFLEHLESAENARLFG